MCDEADDKLFKEVMSNNRSHNWHDFEVMILH